jgi:hypothetical protein
MRNNSTFSSAESRLVLALACGTMLRGIAAPATAQDNSARQPSGREQFQHIGSRLIN